MSVNALPSSFVQAHLAIRESPGFAGFQVTVAFLTRVMKYVTPCDPLILLYRTRYRLWLTALDVLACGTIWSVQNNAV